MTRTTRAPTRLPIHVAPGTYDTVNERQFRQAVEDRIAQTETDVDALQDDVSAISGSIIFAFAYGVTGSGSDESDELQAALDAAEAAGGGIVLLPRGVIRCDSQLTYDGDGLTLMGAGCGGPEGAATTLDLRYASGAKFLVGNGTTRRNAIRFTNFHLVDGAGAAQYIFESRYVRGIKFDNITSGGSIYGFAKLGRSGEATSYIVLQDIWDINLAATSEHFIDCVNVPGPIWFAGHGHVEGPNTIVAASCFCNFGLTSVRPDGFQMAPGWTVRQFARGLNFRTGVGNTDILGTIFDEILDYGIYADTDLGAIGGLRVHVCRFNSDDVTVASRGIFISKTTSSCLDVDIQGNTFYEWGAEGVWITGAMDARVIGNKVANCGQETTNNYGGIRLGTGVTGVVSDNTIITDAANVHQYGVLNESTSINLRVGRNVSVGHGTAAISGFCDEMSFKATKNGTDQTAITSGTPTKLTFGTEVWDVGLGYDTGNSRWTPGPGKVLVGGAAYTSANVVDGSTYALTVYKNGNPLALIASFSASGTNNMSVAGQVEDESDDNDYYELWYEGGGAGDKTVSGAVSGTYFWGKKIP